MAFPRILLYVFLSRTSKLNKTQLLTSIPKKQALILNDFSYPLAQLTLTVVDQASTRAENIDCLNRGIRRRDTNLDAELERLREIRFNIDELFLGLRATPVVGGVWESWPLKVFVAGKYIGHNGFRLGRCKLGGESGDDCGKWCYRRYE